MANVKTVFSGLALLALTSACGTNQKDPKAAPHTQPSPPEARQVESAKADPSEGLNVPDMVMVRIPVDSVGNPTGEPELRTVASVDIADAEAAATAFESGSLTATVSSEGELDADSSTQSWYINRGFGWGFNRWGGWGGWGARLGWGGGYYNFGFNRGYWGGGFRYGCFNRSVW